MINEIYISIILGLIVGWLLKTVEYSFKKKSMRYEKLLDGKIQGYTTTYNMLVSAQHNLILIFNAFKTDDYETAQSLSKDIDYNKAIDK